MSSRFVSVSLWLGLMAWMPPAGAAEGPKGALRPPPVVQTFVARGPSSEMDLARLKAALVKAAGVVTVDLRPTVGGFFVDVKGDVLYTLLAAHAKPAGFQLGQLPSRTYVAKGSSSTADLARLRTSLSGTAGVESAAVSPAEPGGAARVSGIAQYAALVAAAKSAGYELRQIGGFVVAGSSAEGQLAKLKAALQKLPKVEQVELLALTGGATLLVYGDVKPADLTTSAKGIGYELSVLSNGFTSQSEFSVGGTLSADDQGKLRTLVQALEGTRSTELTTGAEGLRLIVDGERLKPDRIAAAAKEAGFALELVQKVTLPSLLPQAGRGTPAAYEDAIVEDPIVAGGDAPPFTLLSKDGTTRLSLSDSLGKKPVVLVFGSCT